LVVAVSQQRVESVGCPHCGGRRLQRWGGASGLPRYRCGDCQRTFNALTGTPLARLRKKEQWAEQAKALMTGESVVKAAERCDVAYTTAFRWRHRFLTAPALDKPKRLTGLVEADETFILESFKGKRSGLPRPSRKRGGKAGKRGLSAEQIPVLVARDRTGATTDAVLPRLNRASVTAALAGVVTPTNDLCCDGGKAIVSFARAAKIPCHILPTPAARVPKPQISTSTMSTGTTGASRSGCAHSTVSPPSILTIIWPGAGPWKHWGRRPGQRTGSSVRSAWVHTNR